MEPSMASMSSSSKTTSSSSSIVSSSSLSSVSSSSASSSSVNSSVSSSSSSSVSSVSSSGLSISASGSSSSSSSSSKSISGFIPASDPKKIAAIMKDLLTPFVPIDSKKRKRDDNINIWQSEKKFKPSIQLPPIDEFTPAEMKELMQTKRRNDLKLQLRMVGRQVAPMQPIPRMDMVTRAQNILRNIKLDTDARNKAAQDAMDASSSASSSSSSSSSVASLVKVG